MANFSRQPALPPHHPAPPASDGQRRPGAPQPPRQPMAHFAILGLDHQTGENISTVIEARSENDAQEMALRMGITIHEFKPMHPLAGAAAVKMARSDPRDRFNQHPSYAQSLAGHPSSADEHDALPHGGPVGRAEFQGSGTIPGTIPGAGAGAVREPTSHNPLGGLAVLAVLGVVGALLYLTVLRDGGAQQVMAMIAPPPAPIEAMYDANEPWDDVSVDAVARGPRQPPAAAFQNAPDGKLHLEATIPPSRNAQAAGLRGSAVIGGQIVTPGQTIAGYRLVQVRDGLVLLQKDGEVVALRIKKD